MKDVVFENIKLEEPGFFKKFLSSFTRQNHQKKLRNLKYAFENADSRDPMRLTYAKEIIELLIESTKEHPSFLRLNKELINFRNNPKMTLSPGELKRIKSYAGEYKDALKLTCIEAKPYFDYLRKMQDHASAERLHNKLHITQDDFIGHLDIALDMLSY